MTDALTELAAGTVTLAIPLIIAASGELVSERAGVLNLSLDGMILTGAFASVATTVATGSPIAGVIGAVLAGLLFGLGQAFLSVTLRANQLIVGIAANALAIGATSYGARLLFSGENGSVAGFSKLSIPVLGDLPVVGAILFSHSALSYAALAIAALLWFVTRRGTRLGLMLDAVGEDGSVADKAGIRVAVVRFAAVLTTGAMAGVAGAELALAELHGFTENMTSGIGYLAVAAVIAGAWRQGRIVVACLVFGLAEALRFAAPTLGIDLPVAILVMSPYLIALVAISGLAGKSRAPSSLTIPFVRAG